MSASAFNCLIPDGAKSKTGGLNRRNVMLAERSLSPWFSASALP
jgi:hypothetical protein